MSKFKKIFIFIMIIFFTPIVFAQDFNVSTSDITSPNSSGTGKYTGTEIANTGTANVYNIGTRYSGKLSRIVFNLASGGYADPDGFEKGHTYTLTMNMATEDWRNKFGSVSVKCEGSSGQELSNKKVTYISMKKIKFSFTTPSNSYCQFVYVDLRSTNTSSVAFTGVSNWNLSSMVISDPTYDNSTPTPTTTPKPDSSNQDIINANNQNTQNIINNNNQNTQDIIDNQTDNTQDIIENNNQNTTIIDNSLNTTCKNGPFALNDSLKYADKNLAGKELTSSGGYSNWNQAFITKYLILKPNSSYTIRIHGGNINEVYYCLYGGNYSLTQCYTYSNRSEINFETTEYNKYIRLTIPNYRYVEIEGPICNDFELEGQQETTEAINKVNDTLKDETTPTIDIDLDMASDTPISDLLLMPLNLINKLQDGFNNSCSPYVLPFDFFGGNNTLTLPCIDLQDYLGNDVYNIIDALLCFFFAFEIGKMCVSIYNSITSLDDGFNALYEPKHGAPDGASSYIGKHGGGAR